ncbi:MAG: hypothetical protein J5766_05440 [Clostridia bacterium]|nr:hypothetical protein [Clostridia bacterium]
MKIKDEFFLKNENGQNIVKSRDGNVANFIVLGNTATLLFELTKERDCSKNEMLDYILNNTDVSTVLALSDLNVFIKLMKENDIFEQEEQ